MFARISLSMRFATSIACFACVFIFTAGDALVQASTGDLDDGFGSTGVVGARGFAQLQAVAIDPQGRVVVAGSRDVSHVPAVARYLANGTVDLNFSENGFSELPGAPRQVISDLFVTPGGRILVGAARKESSSITALDDVGSYDQAFGIRGVVDDLRSSGPVGVAGDAAGRIYVVGSAGVERRGVDGTLDDTYGDAGLAQVEGATRPSAFSVSPDGTAVVGTDAVTRLTPQGFSDPTFGGDGRVELDPVQAGRSVRSLGVSANGSILLSLRECGGFGSSGCSPSLIGLDPSGETTFDQPGGGAAIAPLSDGSFTVAGDYTTRAAARTASAHRVGPDGDANLAFGFRGYVVVVDGLRRYRFVDAALGTSSQVLVANGNPWPVVALQTLNPSAPSDADADGLTDQDDPCPVGFALPSGCETAERKIRAMVEGERALRIRVDSPARSCRFRADVRLFVTRDGVARVVDHQRTSAGYAYFRIRQPGQYFAAVTAKDSLLAHCRSARTRVVPIDG